jgi:hypothetical protein
VDCGKEGTGSLGAGAAIAAGVSVETPSLFIDLFICLFI